jgi:hypothetical protein
MGHLGSVGAGRENNGVELCSIPNAPPQRARTARRGPHPAAARRGWGTRRCREGGFGGGAEVGEGGADAVGDASEFEVVGGFFFLLEDEMVGLCGVGVAAVALDAATADLAGPLDVIQELLDEAGGFDFGDDFADGVGGASPMSQRRDMGHPAIPTHERWSCS